MYPRTLHFFLCLGITTILLLYFNLTSTYFSYRGQRFSGKSSFTSLLAEESGPYTLGGEPHSFQTGSQDWEHTSTSDAFRLYREEVRVDGACSLWCLNGVVMVLEELSKQRTITVPDSIPCCELLPNCKSPFPYIGKTMNVLGLLVLT